MKNDKFLNEKEMTEERAKEILGYFKGHMKPTLGGLDKSQVYKIQKSITLSRIVFEQLFIQVESPNKFLDFLLAQLLDKSYEKCYGRKAKKHHGKNIMWDFQEMFKKLENGEIEVR